MRLSGQLDRAHHPAKVKHLATAQPRHLPEEQAPQITHERTGTGPIEAA